MGDDKHKSKLLWEFQTILKAFIARPQNEGQTADRGHSRAVRGRGEANYRASPGEFG